nr:unnamed protein product [Spirometra erinaceieuropaei]
MSSSYTEAEVARPDPRQAHNGANWDPQHLRHAEITTVMQELPPLTHGTREAAQMTSLRRSIPVLQGYSENFPEATADQPDRLGRPRLGPTYVEENSEDRRSSLRGQPHHRRKTRRQKRKSQLTSPPHNANAQPTPMCP